MRTQEILELVRGGLGDVQSMDQTSPLSHRENKWKAVEKLKKAIELLEEPPLPMDPPEQPHAPPA